MWFFVKEKKQSWQILQRQTGKDFTAQGVIAPIPNTTTTTLPRQKTDKYKTTILFLFYFYFYLTPLNPVGPHQQKFISKVVLGIY